MPRPPLELETWGKIRRIVVDGKHAAVAYYRDSDGKTRKMQRQGKTGAEAERNLIRAMKARLAPAGEDLTADTTVKQAAEKWLAEPERSELAIATVRRYTDILGTIVKNGFGGVRLGEATVPRVDRFLKSVTTENGPSTAKTARTLLQHVFALAVRHGAIRSNPVRDAGRIVQPRKPVVAPDAHSIREMAALMRAYDTTPDKRGNQRVADLGDLFDVFSGTGARTAEILALRWDDVDLDALPRPTISIHGTVTLDADGKVFVQEHPKTDSSRRVLKLPQYVADVLTRRRIHSYCEWVFPSAVGTLRWPHNLRRNWREALAGTPYAEVSPRSLRKAVATRIRDELGIEVAGEQLGHASGSTVTRKHYTQRLAVGPDATSALDAFGENSE
jgi:integrase